MNDKASQGCHDLKADGKTYENPFIKLKKNYIRFHICISSRRRERLRFRSPKTLGGKNVLASQRCHQLRADGDTDEASFRNLNKTSFQQYEAISIMHFLFCDGGCVTEVETHWMGKIGQLHNDATNLSQTALRVKHLFRKLYITTL